MSSHTSRRPKIAPLFTALVAGILVYRLAWLGFDLLLIIHLDEPTRTWRAPMWLNDLRPFLEIVPAIIAGLLSGCVARRFGLAVGAAVSVLGVFSAIFDNSLKIPGFVYSMKDLGYLLHETSICALAGPLGSRLVLFSNRSPDA